MNMENRLEKIMHDLNSWRQRCVRHVRARAALLVALLVLAPAPALAAWPERPLSMVVPYPAGGVADTVSRLLAGELGKTLGQPVVVENRPGASGRIGLEAVRRAAPDGYTIGLAVPATMVLLPLADTRFSLAPADFQPISLACETWTALVVDPHLPIRTLPEFRQYGHDQGGKMTYASAGNGTTFHFGAALLARELGIEASHVAYKGEQPALRDVAAGHVQFMLATNSSRPLIDAGKLVPIAVATEARVSALPGVPTFRELGMPFTLDGWIGYVGPRGLDPRVLSTLEAAFQTVLADPEVRRHLAEMGYQPSATGAAAMQRAIERGRARYEPLVRSGAVHLDH
ncbi:tripartite tricarboxylate transporter substrate binding protein [Achromobacter insuavis]|uniref:tripartite tricarboxylate transporter substrate binding protein n=1 Tax=Achromobacter insuavis TaxID=1287735 RepID=UPI000AFD2528|nr:tripartite tricarboxylate transporter substrate binding protein [Achromobacter insuavis]